MQVNTQRRAQGLRDKIPDITKTLDTVRFFKTRKVGPPGFRGGTGTLTVRLQPDSEPIETTFELNDTLYAKAMVPYTDEVYLWLGVREESIVFENKTDRRVGKRHALLPPRRSRDTTGVEAQHRRTKPSELRRRS